MTKTPQTIDLSSDQLRSVAGGRLFGGQGGWIRPAGVGGGLFGVRQQRLAGGCPSGNCGSAPASGG